MRRVVMVVFDGIQTLDAVGPLEVFAATGEYQATVTSTAGGPVTSASGLTIVSDVRVSSVRGAIDTLMVAGGDGTTEALADVDLISNIRRLAAHARRVTSVCSGAFLLAEAGLLNGRRATTHWSVCDLLASMYPEVSVEPEPIYVRDGNIWTSAGVTAGMDLALALVEDDLGREIALEVARRLVMFLHRPGNQAQFSAQLSAQLAERDAIRELQHWIVGHPGEALTVESMASRAHMSPRHFARVFRAEVGSTPARYVESVRIEAARRGLEDATASIESIASSVGFGTTETMRRAFLRSLGVGPTEYRRRFRAA